MNIQIHSSGFSVSSNLRSFIEKKVEKLETYYDKIISADVYLGLENHSKVKEKKAEIKVNVPNSTLFSAMRSKTFEESSDLAVESIRKQLVKYKEKAA